MTNYVQIPGLSAGTAAGTYLQLDLANDPVGDGTTAEFNIDASIDADFALTDIAFKNVYNFSASVTPTGNTAGLHRAMAYGLTTSSAFDFTANSGLIGIVGQITHGGTGTVASGVGSSHNLTNLRAGTVTEAIAMNTAVLNINGAGEVTEAIGLNLQHGAVAGTFTDYKAIRFVDPSTIPVNPATNVYAFEFADDFISNNRCVIGYDDANSEVRYIPWSEADTGITFDSSDLTLATTTSGDIIVNAIGNIVLDGTTQTKAGRIVNTTRITNVDSPYTVLVTDHHIFCDTDGAVITVNLPAGVEGTEYKIINVGTSGNDLTIDGNGAETIFGAATHILTDGDTETINFNATEHWW